MTKAKKKPTRRKRGLSDKHKQFVLIYLETWNATFAYQSVYPKASYDSARPLASQLLTNVNIQAEIRRLLDQKAMQVEEILARLSDQARANLAELIEFYHVPVLDQDGKLVGHREAVRFREGAFEKYGYLIKSIAPSSTGDFKVELYSAKEAMELIGRHRNMFKDTKLNIDLSKLTDAQLERIASGEDPLKVITNA